MPKGVIPCTWLGGALLLKCFQHENSENVSDEARDFELLIVSRHMCAMCALCACCVQRWTTTHRLQFFRCRSMAHLWYSWGRPPRPTGVNEIVKQGCFNMPPKWWDPKRWDQHVVASTMFTSVTVSDLASKKCWLPVAGPCTWVKSQ